MLIFRFCPIFLTLMFNYIAFADSGLLMNPNLDSHLDGWKVETDIISMVKIDEDFDYGQREKHVLAVSKGSKNDYSKIEINSVAGMTPGLPIYYFIKVGFSGSESAEFKIEILNERNQVINTQVYRFQNNDLFHDIYLIHPVPSPSSGLYKLRILTKNSEDLGTCFIYHAQMGSSLEGIIVEEPDKLYDQLLDFSNKPQTGKWYRVIPKHSGRNLTNFPVSLYGGRPSSNRTIRQIRGDEGRNQTKFKLNDAGDGSYYIESKFDGNVMDICGSSTGCAEVIRHESTGGNNQKWYLESAGEGYYYIKSKHSGYVMDVSAESQSNFAPVLVYPQNWKNNQRFMFTDAD